MFHSDYTFDIIYKSPRAGFIATGVIKIPWHFPDSIHISLTKRNNKSVDEGSKEHISK